MSIHKIQKNLVELNQRVYLKKGNFKQELKIKEKNKKKMIKRNQFKVIVLVAIASKQIIQWKKKQKILIKQVM